MTELVEKAEAVAARAYAPYSNYNVGAVVRTDDGREFEGVNVENAAYPLGVCAEKSALVRGGRRGLRPGPDRGDRDQRLAVRRLPPVAGRVPDPARSASAATTARSRRTTPKGLLPETWDFPEP